MIYLHHIYLPALDLTDTEEAYLDHQARLDLELSRLPRSSYGLWNAIADFKDDLYSLIIDHLAYGEDKEHWMELLNKIKNDKKLDVQKAKNYPIESLFREFGCEIRQGFTCCPIHQEDTPSLKIYQNTNTWHCFGCGAGTDTIDFTMKMGKCNFVDAVKRLI